MVKCPDPYMGKDQPGAPPDPKKGPQDPFGVSGQSYVSYGMCPIDKAYPNDDLVMRAHARAKLWSYELNSHGQFFWNFRTELEPRWSFQEAVKKGWIPRDWSKPQSPELWGIFDGCLAGSFASPAGPGGPSGSGFVTPPQEDTIGLTVVILTVLNLLLIALVAYCRRSRRSHLAALQASPVTFVRSLLLEPFGKNSYRALPEDSDGNGSGNGSGRGHHNDNHPSSSSDRGPRTGTDLTSPARSHQHNTGMISTVAGAVGVGVEEGALHPYNDISVVTSSEYETEAPAPPRNESHPQLMVFDLHVGLDELRQN
jgi:hypothetical protein